MTIELVAYDPARALMATVSGSGTTQVRMISGSSAKIFRPLTASLSQSLHTHHVLLTHTQIHCLEDCGRKAVAWQEDEGFRCHQGPIGNGNASSRWKTIDDIPSPSEAFPDDDRYRHAKVTCVALGPTTTTSVLTLGLSCGSVLIYELDLTSMKMPAQPSATFHASAAAVTDIKFSPQMSSGAEASSSLILAASYRDGYVRTYRGHLDLTQRVRSQDGPVRQWTESVRASWLAY